MLIAFIPHGVAFVLQTSLISSHLAGKPLSRISSCQSSVFSLMYISFGTILASGGRDGSIKMWDAISGVGLAEVKEAHSDSVRGMACDSSGRLLVTASADMSVKIWQQVLRIMSCSIPSFVSFNLSHLSVRYSSSVAAALFSGVAATKSWHIG